MYKLKEYIHTIIIIRMFAFIAASVGVYKISGWLDAIPPPVNPIDCIQETIHNKQEKNKLAIYNNNHEAIIERRNEIREKYHNLHDHK